MFTPSTANNSYWHIKYILIGVKICFHDYKVKYVLILKNGFTI